MKIRNINQTIIIAASFSVIALGVYGLALSATLAQHSVRLPKYKVILKNDVIQSVVQHQ